MTTPPIPDAAPTTDIPAWFRGRTLAELNAFEFALDADRPPRILIPEKIQWRGPRGEERSVDVALALIHPAENDAARLDAIAHVQSLRKRQRVETVEQARDAIGSDRFDNIDSFAILARALREPKPPHGRAYLLSILIESFPQESLFALYQRLDFYVRLFSVRADEITSEVFFAVVSEIARVKNVSPLVAIAGDAPASFIVRMAEELSSSRTSRS